MIKGCSHKQLPACGLAFHGRGELRTTHGLVFTPRASITSMSQQHIIANQRQLQEHACKAGNRPHATPTAHEGGTSEPQQHSAHTGCIPQVKKQSPHLTVHQPATADHQCSDAHAAVSMADTDTQMPGGASATENCCALPNAQSPTNMLDTRAMCAIVSPHAAALQSEGKDTQFVQM
jgi:hypothetical protein